MESYIYHIVEFKELPYSNIEKYVCVPDSWIRWRDTDSKQVIIAYPDSNMKVLKDMVKNKEKYSEHWKLYKAFRRHGTDSYECAMRIIKTKQDAPSTVEEELNNIYEQFAKLQLRVEQLEEQQDAHETPEEEESFYETAQADLSHLNLPPDFDENDPTWTLKHREYREGLVPLRPTAKIKVYVDCNALDKWKRSSSDCNELARHLLEEVFTSNALKVCSWTGRKGNNGNCVHVRPGLYLYAREQLVTCVLTIGREKGWPADKQKVVKYLQGRLQTIRKPKTPQKSPK
ncbi:uncharacterized protein LOC125232133 [Leguminivora glycinivorella]|uniref:uncharacterized protein LOC125232133 n=1 Tax=Leguminivora glycinivorella TaxID=1035111 RepID=UPI00200BA76E|nr:uncharacterized protein LOC125232133 [Leguminivora glycinivorella]